MADNAVEPSEMEDGSSPYRDFDEGTDYVAPIRIKVCGREYELPGDVPAGPILLGMKKGISMAEDSAEMVRFLELLIGPARLQQMVDDGMGQRQLNELTRWISKQYGFDADTEDDAENLTPPPRHIRRQKTSSKSGRSSKPTSGGTIKSVSPTS